MPEEGISSRPRAARAMYAPPTRVRSRGYFCGAASIGPCAIYADDVDLDVSCLLGVPNPAPSRGDGNHEREFQELHELILECGVPGSAIARSCRRRRSPRRNSSPATNWPIPRGVNIVTAIGGINWGDVAFEPSLPVDASRDRDVGTRVLCVRSGRPFWPTPWRALPVVGTSTWA